jgi:transketolase|tara:strand:+ start:1497 stop:2429 length:933 start_codon:yes stop_codon:yes gene_type:complete
MIKSYFQRDEFINNIFKHAKKDKKVQFISVDFGAPALDQFRSKLKNQFTHLGICEQNAVDFACGMALEGHKSYIYAMAPFISLRCLEQHKASSCLMNLDVTTIVTGIGLSYANSGPTHYATEDLACLRSLPNAIIYTASDPLSAKLISEVTYKTKGPKFVRLDRKASENFNNKIDYKDVIKGYRFLKKGSKKNICIISHGTIIKRAVDAAAKIKDKFQNNISIVDLIRCKPFPKTLSQELKKFDYLLTLDEQTYSGGLFSILSERVDHKKILNFSIPDKFIFENNGRELLLDQNGLSVKNIYNKLNNICN